jgi:hypothetical protein
MGMFHSRKSVARQNQFVAMQFVLRLCFAKSGEFEATAFEERTSSTSPKDDMAGGACVLMIDQGIMVISFFVRQPESDLPIINANFNQDATQSDLGVCGRQGMK